MPNARVTTLPPLSRSDASDEDVMGPDPDTAEVRRLAGDPGVTSEERIRAREWLAMRELLDLGPRLQVGLIPRAEAGHADLRRQRVTLALRRLESWEARTVLLATVEDPDEGLRIALAWDLAALGEGMVLDLLSRLSAVTQPDSVRLAVATALRANLARLPTERVASLLRGMTGGSTALQVEVLSAWVDLASSNRSLRGEARAACAAVSADPSRRSEVREAAELGIRLSTTGEDPPASPSRRGLWRLLTDPLPWR